MVVSVYLISRSSRRITGEKRKRDDVDAFREYEESVAELYSNLGVSGTLHEQFIVLEYVYVPLRRGRSQTVLSHLLCSWTHCYVLSLPQSICCPHIHTEMRAL